MTEFDYIVVGAGAAGSALAGRLSEDPALRVLLLEAGPRDRKLEIRLPAAFPKLFRSRFDYGGETAPEDGLGGRSVFFPRGRTLGGSTSINAQIYTRGAPADFDAWAEAAGRDWGYEALLPLFRRGERNARGADRFHGGDGPLHVQDLRDPSPLARGFVAAALHAGVAANEDFNAHALDGAGLVQVTQRRGRRWSAADAYLRPARSRPNLTVRTGARAEGLVWAQQRRVCGVRVAGETLRARREVVLCAGAIGTPELLMRSGVGPGEHLRAHGVEVRHHLPGVGQRLQDHVMAPVVFTTASRRSLKAAESPPQLARYLMRRRGMLTSNIAEAAAFVRTRPDLPGPDLELLFAPAMWEREGLDPPPAHGFSIGVVCVAPRSSGQVALGPSGPVIRPGYLSDPDGHDLGVLLAGLELARRIAGAPGLREHGPAERPPTAGDDAERAIRAVAQTLYHPAGSCRMGSDALAVVDPGLRVHGVDGLRVADASVMPTLVRAHTQAAAYAIGERAADLLRAPGSVADHQPRAEGEQRDAGDLARSHR